MTAKAETQAGARLFRRQADRGENVRRLDGAGRASGASGAGQTLQVERDEERLAFDAGENEIRRVGGARSAAAIDARVGNAIHQAMLQLIPERAEAFGVVCERMAGDLSSFAEANDARNIFRARTNAALVMAAVKELLQTSAAAKVKSANAFGGVQFVARKRKKIEAALVHVDGNFPRGLHGISMEIDIGFFGDATDFFEGLNRAELVVSVHDGDEHGFLANRAVQILEIDQAVLVHVKISNIHALLFQSLASVKNGFVLDKRGDHVGTAAWGHSGGADDSEDGVVVGLGAAAGEENLSRSGANQRGNLFAGGFDGSARPLAEGMDGRGIAKLRREIGKHGVEHFGLDGGGGVVIEVDAVHSSTHIMILDMILERM